MKKILFFIFLYIISIYGIHAQYDNPLKIPMTLSANFGELRNNHFHSGIDIKTEGVINKPVHSIADGYISRIFVSPGGYGLALYITHPQTGHVSVYGHLEKFTPEIDRYVKEQQYQQESYRVDLFPDKELFPVKKGELIAYSGNTGSSGGPHVHFEIRDEKTEYILDPLEYYKETVNDKAAPDVRGIAVYPISGEGVVNGNGYPVRQNITKTKKGDYSTLKIPIQAWGKIGVGVKAYDRMTGTSNIYGVKIVRLYVDNNIIFESRINSYSFDQTRMLNTFVDFEDWRKSKSFFMKSFVEPGNKLPFYEAINNGYITIDNEKIYNIRYELEDIYGNITKYSFQINGKKQTIPQPQKGSLYMVWDEDNYFINEDFSLNILKGNLYNNFMFTFKQSPSPKHFSNRIIVNNFPVALHNQGEMKIRLNTDTLTDKNQYGIVSLNGNKESWIGGTYIDGYIHTTVREIGNEYAVSSDEEAPVITPIQEEKWEKSSEIKIKVTDNKSGVKYCKGTIDGNFALFRNDVKSAVYTYKLDSERLTKGQKHQLVFIAKDACGNMAEYTTEFYY